MTCKITQRRKIGNNKKNNIVLNMASSTIQLEYRIKTKNGWVTKVDLLHKGIAETSHVSKEPFEHLQRF